jgi:hypothetical protein
MIDVLAHPLFQVPCETRIVRAVRTADDIDVVHFSASSAEIALATRAKPARSSVSPRTEGERPQETRRSESCCFVYSPKPGREAVHERLAPLGEARADNAEEHLLHSQFRQGGSERIRSVSTADVTFGCGMKHEGGTSKSSSGSA